MLKLDSHAVSREIAFFINKLLSLIRLPTSQTHAHTHILPTLSDSPDGAVKSASDFKTLVTLLIKPIIWILQLKHISYISSLFTAGKHH